MVVPGDLLSYKCLKILFTALDGLSLRSDHPAREHYPGTKKHDNTIDKESHISFFDLFNDNITRSILREGLGKLSIRISEEWYGDAVADSTD
jgi:hypothetical protein